MRVFQFSYFMHILFYCVIKIFYLYTKSWQWAGQRQAKRLIKSSGIARKLLELKRSDLVTCLVTGFYTAHNSLRCHLMYFTSNEQ